MKPTVFIPEPIAPPGLELLRKKCECVAPWLRGVPVLLEADDQCRALLARADAVIVRLFRVDEQVLKWATRLRVIGKHGVGMDNIDCDAAATRDIPVLCTPDSSSQAVAEHAIALMLSLSRQLDDAGRAVRDGRFQERTQFQGVELGGKTLTIVGLGRIGSRVALIAAGFGMRVLAVDPYLRRSDYCGPAVLVDDLEAALAEADFVSLHVPLTEETRGMMGADRLTRLKSTCRLVNTCRGAVLDEAALAEALGAKVIAGAAIDVFSEEPVPPDHPLCHAPNTVLTPHVAGMTHAAMQRTSAMVAQGVIDILEGRRAEHVVNSVGFQGQ